MNFARLAGHAAILGFAVALIPITGLAGQAAQAQTIVPGGARQQQHKPSRTAPRQASLANTRTTWPEPEKILRVVLLRDYTTRWVLLGTLVLGTCAGIVGTFTLLRRRALVGDVVGHASLPGIAVAFIVMEMIQPGSGKWLPGLLAGALVAGVLGILCTVAIRRFTRINEDAALALVLSVFFGVGIALFTVIQNIPTGNQAGLNHFIFGKVHAMVDRDVYLITAAACIVFGACVALFKEFSLLCFDEGYAGTQGWPTTMLDVALMMLVVGVTVIGLQSVGLILVVALLIIPAASARFWTENLFCMTLVAAALGGFSACLGVMASALFPRLPAGAVIVVFGAIFFLGSMLFGHRRGVIGRAVAHWRLKGRVGRHDLLRAIYEFVESESGNANIETSLLTKYAFSVNHLLPLRSWSAARLKWFFLRAKIAGLVKSVAVGQYRLTEEGAVRAQRVVRNHRLWEMYLIQYADIAPSHVDRDADAIEHILGTDLIQELTELLAKQHPELAVPPSPHTIQRQIAVHG